MAEPSQCFKKHGDLVTRRIAGETIIVTVRSNVADLDCVYTLDEVGTRIWELLDGHHSLSRIAQAIQSDYEVTPEQACDDVVDFVGSLQDAGLVEAMAEATEV